MTQEDVSSPKETRRVHFSGLTEIRGLAALAVVLAHIDQKSAKFGIPNLGLHETGIAGHAVTVFFVLSGFLITYLLAQEEASTGTVSVGRFYMRRILRIWPVYYLALALSLLSYIWIDHSRPNDLATASILYLAMLPNLAVVLGHSLFAVVPLWSVGVEEQFYLIWPWLVRRTRRLTTLLSLIVASYLVVKTVLYALRPESGVYQLILLTRIDCMALGGLLALAYLHHQVSRLHQLLCSKVAQTLAIAALISPFILPPMIANLEVELLAVGAGIWIYNSALNDDSFLRLSARPLEFAGKISYGVYVYHMGVISVLPTVLRGAPALAVYAAVLAITIVIAWLSFTRMEQPLLRLKKRYEIIGSRA